MVHTVPRYLTFRRTILLVSFAVCFVTFLCIVLHRTSCGIRRVAGFREVYYSFPDWRDDRVQYEKTAFPVFKLFDYLFLLRM